ncbi:ubiquitin-conjugating enzyme E2 T [Chlorella sorokiniana]|uniref:E2 ubiquitin-conjugating enzyme n=1 Tax=Chlorella sorokiniana TaxID=3076 RepID=A0A2P6TNF7_CHLSO|nr:ubiquitin-conjugating enzyme E2 T [Chlorella sorokiniana]|eukprot:PRW50870.1 ubiquitin-conjugating enzyme E2 T [Chlorella sorokiniana]
MQREVRMLQTDPPPGVWAAPKNGERLTELEAQIQGPKDTVYEGGLFRLSVDIPARYPFEPPKVKFVTPIYHPNIDPEGRICLDILNMPPKGGWKPALNVSTVLASIGLLLEEPNPDDGLVTDITAEFKHQRQVFDAKARQWTQRHAMPGSRDAAADAAGDGAKAAAAAGAGGGEAAEAPAGGEQQQQQQQQPAGADEGPKENSNPAAAGEGAAAGKPDQTVAGEQAAAHPAQPAKRPRLALRK